MKTKNGKRAAESNGHVDIDEVPLSAVELGRRHIEGPPTGVGPYRCNDCGHGWTAHDKVRTCPKCKSPAIRAEKRGDGDAVPDAARLAAGPIAFALVPIGSITASDDNPRKAFDAAKLAELAETIKTHGILEPLLLRQLDDGQLVVAGGERRLRAAKLAGLDEVPAITRVMTDGQFAEVQLIENLQREDLNAIEEAEAFQRAIAVGGYTQERLAERLGVTQGHVANRLALIKLPEAIRFHVAAGNLPSTHARAVMPWLEFGAVVKAIAKKLADSGSGTLDEWNRSVLQVVHFQSKTLQWGNYPYEKVDLTDDERQRLNIRDVPNYWGKGTEPRAFNVKLWSKINSRVVAEQNKKRAKSTGGGSGRSTSKKAKDESPQVFGRKLWEYREEWFGGQVAQRIAKADAVQVLKLLVTVGRYGECPFEGLGELLGLKSYTEPGELLPVLWKCKAAGVPALLQKLVTDAFLDQKGAARGSVFIEDGVLPAIAEGMGVTWLDWKPEAAFLELWSDKRLDGLAQRKEFGGTNPARTVQGHGRKRLVEHLLGDWPKGFVPPELKTVDQFGKFQSAETSAKGSTAKSSKGKR